MAKKGAKPKQATLFQLAGGRMGDQIIRGNVVTEIYANLKPWGEVEFKIRQQRILPQNCDQTYGSWFKSDDLRDMMRGAYEAQRRIRKRHRRLLWKGLLGW